MKMRLHKLSSEPEAFTPITFHAGINLILGEKVNDGSAQDRKVNAVGKSLSVEFLHFALGRDFTSSRLSRIPDDTLPPDTVVILDFSINEHVLQVRRSLQRPDQPIVFHQGASQTFATMTDALHFLEALLYAGMPADTGPSLRALLSVLMRDERSEFVSILSVLPAEVKASPDVTPHLFLMGLDTARYQALAQAAKALEEQAKLVSALTRDVTENGRRKTKEVAAELNQERVEVAAIEEGLKQLQAEPAYADLEKQINSLEGELAELRAKRKAVAYQLNRILEMPQPEFVDDTDIAIVYNRVKAGLGDLVTKSLEQAKAFKQQIESFQRALLQDESARLKEAHSSLTGRITQLADEHSALMRQLDHRGALQELRVGLTQAVAKQERYTRRSLMLEQLTTEKDKQADLKLERDQALASLRIALKQAKSRQDEIGATINAIHARVMGSSHSSFSIELSDKARKHPIDVDLEIQDDGSHSVGRTKIFIYDAALLFASCTQDRHPGFLLHDNLFDVDQDTLVQCLNYLQEQQDAGADFQYVLTLNREKIEAEERQHLLKLDVTKLCVASLTRSMPFLRKRYQELRKKQMSASVPQEADSEEE